MKGGMRYLKSFFSEDIVERSSSPYNEALEVAYAYGRLVLNTQNVNYSFGLLDKVFRSTFSQLRVDRRDISDVLILGLGAGNVASILREHRQTYRMVGVEIDAEVVRLARNHFGLEDYGDVEVVVADAADFVRSCGERFDLVVVDLFVDATVPLAAEQDEFLLRLEKMLRPGGLLLFNRLMHSPELLQQTEAFTRKMAKVLPGTKFLKADSNRVLYYEKNP